MDPSQPPTPRTSSVFPWLLTALVIILAAGGIFWMNQRIEALQTAVGTTRPDPTVEETEKSVASLHQIIQQIQTDQQKLGDQVTQIQHGVAAEQGNRKLLSDQIGSLSARVDALASAHATAAAPTEPSQQTSQGETKRRRR